MTALLLLFALLQTEPSATPPSIIPRADAPVFLNRVGPIDTLTIHYSRREAENIARWDVIIKDRALLSRIEKMRESDWHGMVLFVDEHSTTTRIGDDKFSGSLGVLKFTGRPFGLRIKVNNQPWAVYVESGEAGADLAKLIDAEATKQRPKK